MKIEEGLKVDDLDGLLTRFWQLSGDKILNLESANKYFLGSPVFTKNGIYTSKGWTEWTQGFQYGSALLQFEASQDEHFLDVGRAGTLEKMAPHLTHIGVHDHGFNNLSTYGNLLRLMEEGIIDKNPWERNFYQLAIKVSGAVQASRWTETKYDGGYIYSFNGPHSLFIDTLRSVRILMCSHFLDHSLKSENDEDINLFERGIKHILTTIKYNIYQGEGRDSFDVAGRTAHECIFNTNDGNFRSPNSQQGYSGYTTWTRGLAWAICGLTEQLELIKKVPDHHFEGLGAKNDLINTLLKNSIKTCDFYMAHCASDGIPYWDTGAPTLSKMGSYTQRPSDPFNKYEPIDSSAAAIAAQGFIRLGLVAGMDNYVKAGLTIAKTLLNDTYMSLDPNHQGLLLHSIYHQPNGWDHVPIGQVIACNESSMWGDYHVRELMILIHRLKYKRPLYSFFNCIDFLRNI